MNSLRECVACKDIKDTTYLLPCLHPTCSQCLEDIVQDAKQKKRKLPGCRDCGETFVQDKLTTVPSKNSSSTSTCSDCDQPATHYCRDCKIYMCKAHGGDGHATSKRFKGHVVQLVVELPFCNKHSNETAVGFCSNCKVLLCTNCTLTEHNKSPHVLVTLQEAAKATSDSVKKYVAKLLESIPAIDKEIEKYTDIRTKLEKERAELEAKIGDIRKQEKVTTLQIEDLEKTKALLLITQTQANTLASAATTLPHATLLRLQNVITTRVSNLQAGFGLISGLVSSSAIFNRVFTQYITVSNNGKTITSNTGSSWGYAIIDDGCSSGVRSWRFIINAIPASYGIMLGIWNSSNAPSPGDSYYETNAWLVHCWSTGNRHWKAGSSTNLNSLSPLQYGDVILLTVDAHQRRLTVHNTTRGWTHIIDQLPSPNPVYYPHVVLCGQGFQVSMEAAS